jgi:hypothetical protein
MLGFDISERSVARYLRRVPRRGDPARRWSACRPVEPKPSEYATVGFQRRVRAALITAGGATRHRRRPQVTPPFLPSAFAATHARSGP